MSWGRRLIASLAEYGQKSKSITSSLHDSDDFVLKKVSCSGCQRNRKLTGREEEQERCRIDLVSDCLPNTTYFLCVVPITGPEPNLLFHLRVLKEHPRDLQWIMDPHVEVC